DQRTGKQYPEILLLKSPWPPEFIDPTKKKADNRLDGMYIRLVKDQRIEIVFHEGSNYIELDAQNRKIVVRASGWDVDVSASAINAGGNILGGNVNITASGSNGQRGVLTLSGDEVNISSQRNMNIS